MYVRRQMIIKYITKKLIFADDIFRYNERKLGRTLRSYTIEPKVSDFFPSNERILLLTCRDVSRDNM